MMDSGHIQSKVECKKTKLIKMRHAFFYLMSDLEIAENQKCILYFKSQIFSGFYFQI